MKLVWQHFFNVTPKAKATKAKINKWDDNKLENLAKCWRPENRQKLEHIENKNLKIINIYISIKEQQISRNKSNRKCTRPHH